MVLFVFQKYSQDLPKLDSLKDYNPYVLSEVFADDGTKIGEFWKERRVVLSPQEIPKVFEQAMIASEDASFFQHSGLDYLSIVRAMIQNIKAGQIVQGASTITQQVVTSFLLTKQRKWERKIKEAILAKRIEENFSKQEILYLYLNQVYFGNRAYGIEAAAENYFHKPAQELSIAETTMIVGLVKAPHRFSPIRNFTRAKVRQEYVIDRMLKEGFISEEQAELAKKEPLQIFVAPTDKEYNLRFAPWFVEEVRRDIIKRYGENVPYTHGLKIHTTLDLKAQAAAHKAVWKGLLELHKRHGYKHVVKHLPKEEFERFNRQNSQAIFFSNLEPGILLPNITDEQILKTKIKLKPDTIYQGLISEIDAKNKTMLVTVGNATGLIIPKDFGWARKRNNDAHGWDGVMHINTPVGTFTVGDVIEIKLVDPSSLTAPEQKIYEKGKTYFSLEETPQAEGALYSYDLNTGFVKTIIGGKDFSTSEFDRATQAMRQTGSVFKPILYASALDKGYTPDTVIDDVPLRIPDGPGRVWSPQNYGGGFMGPITFRKALVHSRNVASVRIILDIGVDTVTAMIRKLGITTPVAKVYSMALGANDMKLKEVTRAFGTFPKGGILPELIMIKKMTDRFGTTIEENHAKSVMPFAEQIEKGIHQKVALADETSANKNNLSEELWDEAQKWIKLDRLQLTPHEEILLFGKHIPKGYIVSPKTAATMVSLMQDIVNFGTGYRVKSLGKPVAGKTGTTNDQTDCWFIGYTPSLAAGVWVGYDDAATKVGGGETGGKAAAPIFLYYMQEYLKDQVVDEFVKPEDLHLAELAELDPPIEVKPNDVGSLFTSGEGKGGADFFADDI